jgi:hypothetical protein
MRRLASVLLVLAVLPLASCSYLDRLTGQTDDTVLPGTREDAIPGHSQYPDPNDNVAVEQPGGGPLQGGTGTMQGNGTMQGGGTMQGDAATTVTPKCKPDDPKCQTGSGGVFNDPQ